MAAASRRLGAWLRAHAGPLRRVPSHVWIGGLVAALVLAGFVAAVLPLLTTGGGAPSAELAGRFPQGRLAPGSDVVMAVALDNTGGAVIQPVCLALRSDPGGVVAAVEANFQGLETVAFRDGRACGGELSGGETITVRLVLRPLTNGTARLTLVAAQGSREIGPALRGSIEVGS